VRQCLRLKPQCANACGYLFAARIMPYWGETALARGWGLMAPEPSLKMRPFERRIIMLGHSGKTV